MKTYNSIYNIAYKNIDNHINILYSPNNSIFDLLVQSLNINLYNIESLYNYNYYYDLLWSNNFLTHTQQTKNIAYQSHLTDMVWFHGSPPTKFKKEDIALVRNQLQKTIKVFNDQLLARTWGFDPADCTIIPYGIPENIDYENIEKTETVLLINSNNNSDIANLYDHIKSSIPSAQIIDNISSIESIDILYHVLSKYKIIIDIYNPITPLVAAYLGCKSITSTTQPTALTGITRLLDYSTINQVIGSVLNDRLSSDDISNNQQWIKQNHNFNNFTTSIIQLLNKIKLEEFFIP